MASITQNLRFKQVIIEYSFKYGVTRAATTTVRRKACDHDFSIRTRSVAY